jgi:hypothetical protein
MAVAADRRRGQAASMFTPWSSTGTDTVAMPWSASGQQVGVPGVLDVGGGGAARQQPRHQDQALREPVGDNDVVGA